MKKNKLFIAVVLLTSAFFTIESCTKEKERGCMDPASINYNPQAEEDIGSCAYSGKMLFWIDSATSNHLITAGKTMLKFYVDGGLIDSVTTNNYFHSAPECGNSSVITVTRSLGGNKTRASSYVVKDQDANVVWSSSQVVTANTCTPVLLTY